MDWDKISCQHCADFVQGFCKGYSRSGPEEIDMCLDEMVTELKGSCTVEADGMGGITVMLTHESLSGISHPHMYGISGSVLKQMERNIVKGKYEVQGGCECDWNNIARIK